MRATKEKEIPWNEKSLKELAVEELVDYASMDHLMIFLRTIYGGFLESNPAKDYRALDLANMQCDYDMLMQFLHTLDKAALLEFNERHRNQ